MDLQDLKNASMAMEFLHKKLHPLDEVDRIAFNASPSRGSFEFYVYLNPGTAVKVDDWIGRNNAVSSDNDDRKFFLVDANSSDSGPSRIRIYPILIDPDLPPLDLPTEPTKYSFP